MNMRKLSYYSLLLMIPAAILVWTSCGKDKLRSKPSIKLKSISTRELQTVNDPHLIVELDYADKEGDVGGDAALWVNRTYLNQRQTALKDPSDFTLAVPVPSAPRQDGQIEAHILASEIYMALDPGNPRQPDSINLKFVLRDAAGNTSDTLDAGMVVVIR